MGRGRPAHRIFSPHHDLFLLLTSPTTCWEDTPCFSTVGLLSFTSLCVPFEFSPPTSKACLLPVHPMMMLLLLVADSVPGLCFRQRKNMKKWLNDWNSTKNWKWPYWIIIGICTVCCTVNRLNNTIQYCTTYVLDLCNFELIGAGWRCCLFAQVHGPWKRSRS